MKKSEHQFSLRNKDHAYHLLKSSIQDKLMNREEKITDLPSLCSALNISLDEESQDELTMSFLMEIIAEVKGKQISDDERGFKFPMESSGEGHKLREASGKYFTTI